MMEIPTSILIVIGAILVLGLIYLFMIMPRIWQKPEKSPHMGVMYAHRG